ncbi:MAG: formate--tetrahydrofolate ligase [Myxococcales bacterium]|nr:formate--tetrahydrofolate ligase [Myxococcales bacterium]
MLPPPTQAAPSLIADVARRLELSPDDLLFQGPHLAKLSWATMARLRAKPPRGKLVLVSAMTPTKYGEGKTTTTIGLVQGLVRKGAKAMAALREPSLGPVFGAKGGGTGGGKASLEPSARINLHCTGDLHAITAANNLLAALVDNAINFDQKRFKQVTWKRCIDMNDRFLRSTVIGLGGPANGVPREDGFDITAASEIMATLCLADGVADLKKRLARLIVGIGMDGKPITAGDLNAVGSMAALLGDALLPNLAQTTEGVPALVHGGPFANIAHGCNSVMATRAALSLADVVVTEAGFAFDLGGEKFLDLKCRMSGLWPHAVVLVATARALRFHGGDQPGLASIEKGFGNVARHIRAIKSFGLTPIISLNVFAQDTEEELALVEKLAKAEDVKVARNNGYLQGGSGAEAIAALVLEALEGPAPKPQFTYPAEAPFEEKVRAIAKTVYGAKDVELSADARKDLARLEAWGLAGLPVCMAKTHLSLSDDPTKQGAPEGFTVTVRQVRASAGAGFLLALTGEILTMPGLPKVPAAYNLDLTEAGDVIGVQ